MVDWELLVVHSLAVFSIGLFTAGFIVLDGARWSDNVSEIDNTDILLFEKELNEFKERNSSHKQPLVLMVIDALRDDFLDRKNDLPFLSNELSAGRACRLTVTVDTPTVTMPRIKSLVTGRSSSFLDVILNLGSAELHMPNLIETVGRNKVVFYGDDTWLKLLPNAFLRSEGTHSFFVNDFYEVDTNITRHLREELRKNDWSLLILHYLGLDHIGHVEGPRSPLVGPKLQEMDAVIQLLHQGPHKPLILITGDHGMHNGGGHGGATAGETTVGVALVGSPCVPGSHSGPWNQVDLAPTLASLLGVKVPEGSVGAIVPSLLGSLGPEMILEGLFKNTKRLLKASPGHRQESLFLEGIRVHKLWLQRQSEEDYSRAAELYTTAAIKIRDTLAASRAPFDMYAMVLGVIGASMCALWTLLSLGQKKRALIPTFWVLAIAGVIIGVNSAVCGVCDGRSLVCSISFSGIGLHLIASLASAWTIMSLGSQAKFLNLKYHPDWPLILLAIGHTMSLGSSFCVEEEHLVWYIMWPLVLLVACCCWPRRWPLHLVALLGHLVIVQFNSTGDKWASAPDLEDWLVPHPIARSAILASGLCALVPLVGGGQPFVISLLVLIYLQKAATKAVILPHFGHYLSQNGLVEAWSFYFLLAVFLTYRLSKLRSGQKAVAWRDALVLLAALLRRPHDVLALAYVTFASRLVIACLRGPAVAIGVTVVGWTGYFYQGNSNGLATLDVAAGYVGLQSYRPLVVGFQMAIHTYAAPLLAVLELSTARDSDKWLRLWCGQRLVASAFYLIVAAWLREHLFVWSVFAPKLLYEGVHTLVYLIAIIFLSLLF